MKNLTFIQSKFISAFILSAGICLIANAQKLPNKQEVSLIAPANVKTDGKTSEWNNQFQAYNPATSVFYTLANEHDKLYLVLQATNPTIIQKILNNGVVFTIKGPDKSNAPVIITFPVISSAKDKGDILNTVKNKDVDINAVLGATNNQLITACKEIGVRGIKDITDTLISVYNERDIKAAAQIDNQKSFSYELALPLKDIQPLIDKTGTFKYNIKLEGMQNHITRATLNGKATDPNSPALMELFSKLSASPNGGDFQEIMNTTDFSGTYTLAKKP